MDFNSLKEEFINICNNVYSSTINSPGFYFIKEKYDHLSSLQRKIFHTICLLILLSILFYYPTSYLYSSWRNMREFNIKQELTQELMDLSSTKKTGVSSSYVPGQDPVKFIERRMPVLQIPKNQIQQIKRLKAIQKNKLPFPAKVETVEVEIQNLNLKEIVEYGHKLEQLSNNIKLMNLRIKENPKKDNYFNVSYILSFFSLTKDTSPETKNTLPDKKIQIKPKTENLPTRVRDASPPPSNDKIFDNLKTPSPPPLPAPKLNLSNEEKPDEKNDLVPLMEFKKDNIREDSHFENRPDEVKKRDLLPALPMPQDGSDSSNIPTPPPPDNSTAIKKDK